MRVLTSDLVDRWTRGAGLVALVALAWAVVAPGGVFWSAILAAGLVGAAVATTLLANSRAVPSLAQVVAAAASEPVGPTTGTPRPGPARHTPKG